MRKTILAFAIPCSLAQAIPVYANDGEGGYLGIKAGLSKNDHSCEATALECDRSDTGYGIFGGYDFSRRFGLEIGYTDVADSTAVYPEIRLEGELTAIDIAAKYSRSLFGKSRIFAKVGATYWQGEVKGWGVKVDGSGFSPAFGVGIALPFADRLSTRLEYQYFGKVGDSELGHTQPTLLSLGITWHFSGDPSASSTRPATTLNPPPAAPATPPPTPKEILPADEPVQSVDPANDTIVSPPPAEIEPAPEPLMDEPVIDEPVIVDDVENPAAVAEEDDPQSIDASDPEDELVADDDTAPDGPVIIDDHSSSPLFSKGSSVLKINYALEKIAVDLLRRPHLFVHIVVHTDDQGGGEQNRQLSNARAIKLADYLKWQGVSPDRITVEGKGEANPIADKNIEVGRARSRRVEFFISETRTRR